MSEPKPKAARASTSSKNRTTRSPSPYRSRSEQSIGEFVNEFWQHTINVAESSEDDFKHQALPLARIKKVMKSDPEVRMISSEVTILFEKACQIFIQELTARSHLVSLSSRRRTLSRPDVAQAILKSDMFDFLIDIVPREEQDGGPPAAGGSAGKKRGKGKGRKKREVEVEEEEEVEEPVAQRRRVEEEREPVEGTTLLEQLQRSKEALLLQHAAENGGAGPNGNGQGYPHNGAGPASGGHDWVEGYDYSNASHFYQPHPE